MASFRELRSGASSVGRSSSVKLTRSARLASHAKSVSLPKLRRSDGPDDVNLKCSAPLSAVRKLPVAAAASALAGIVRWRPSVVVSTRSRNDALFAYILQASSGSPKSQPDPGMSKQRMSAATTCEGWWRPQQLSNLPLLTTYYLAVNDVTQAPFEQVSGQSSVEALHWQAPATHPAKE